MSTTTEQTQRWNRDPLVLWSLGVAVLLYCVCSVIDTFWTNDPWSITLSAIILTLTLLILTGKKTFIVLSVVASCVADELSNIAGLEIICILFSALLIWGYIEKKIAQSLALPLVAFALLEFFYCFRHGWRDSNLNGVILYLLLCLIPWIVGKLILRKNTEKEVIRLQMELHATEQALAQKNRDAELAKMLHDSITNDLSLVMLMTDDPEEALTSEDVTRIHGLSGEALRKVHVAIRSLTDDSDDSDALTPATCTCANIRNLYRENDSQLAAIGYQGSAVISGDDSTVVSHECLDLVQELYANILRHATAENATYDFAIKATPKGVRIMQSNECSGHDRKGIAPGGSGLLLHAKAIDALGGTFKTSIVDGLWIANAWIPAPHKATRS